MLKIVAMVIFVGGGHGGATTIQGFHSLASCEAAIPRVVQSLAPRNPLVPPPAARCLEIDP